MSLSDLSINSKAALAHFDYYYTEAYGPVAWRSMRVALLMPPKHAILYNRYFPDATTTVPLSSHINNKNSFLPNINVIQTLIEHQNTLLDDVFDTERNLNIIDEVVNVTQSNSPRRQYLTRYSPSDEDINTTNLNEFIPSTELISEQEIYTRECDTDFTYYSKDYYGITKEECEEENNTEIGLQSIKILTEKQFHMPDKLCIKCSPPGRLVAIPDPIYMNGQFNILSVDLGSVVTILALNLQKNDNMLNMSTFSGTKSVIALQTGLLIEEGTTATKFDTICLNDLTSYLSVNIDSEYKFNKILVNVPCSADRYAINSGAINVFGPGQTQLRTNLPRNQLNLLLQAMELCQPGGDVVYSTSTLSPGQNQEIIQSFIVNYSKNMNFALINLKPLYNLLTACFSKLGIKVIPIHLPLFTTNENSMKEEMPMDTCHGLLIIPSISCNYGPTFIAKFKRLR
ncbi:5-methylcytosine rRNA methyltransferase NSUN4 [Schistosoma japonicum]|nr:5-methylcytosine rRNA methyltransferase NSUN4 [Schistosoma japonicum]